MNDMVFFKLSGMQSDKPTIESGYSFKQWKPSILKIFPKGLKIFPFVVWWIMHHTGFFSNNEYTIFIIYYKKKIVHRSCVFPSFFRFPFMKKKDLQIGDIWTHPDCRGKGLASFTLNKIIRKYKDRYFLWYLTTKDNFASIKLAKSVGFEKYGEGSKVGRFGLKILGYYKINRRQNDKADD